MSAPARRLALAVAAVVAAACSSGSDEPPAPPPAPVGAGIQQGASLSALQNDGWIVCWQGTYATFGVTLASILQNCQAEYMMLACRADGVTDTLTLAAADRREVVTQVDARENSAHHVSGSVGWYYTEDYSWGFFPAGQGVFRSSCDYNDGTQVVPELRLCWHTGSGMISGGYRCGANDLNGNATWTRLVLVHH